jgi:hypothetical protein
MDPNYEMLRRDYERLKQENDRLKEHIYLPKIVNNVFDYFIWINKNISETIEQLEKK